MKTLLLAAVAVAALSAPAAAAELPRAYLGKWCAVEIEDGVTLLSPIKGASHVVAKVGLDEPCGEDGGPIVIRRNGLDYLTNDGEMGEPCRFVGTIKTGQPWPRWTKPLKNDWVPEVTISMRCEEAPAYKIRLQWLKGDQISMTRVRR